MGLLRAAGAIAVPDTKVLHARSSESFTVPVSQVVESVRVGQSNEELLSRSSFSSKAVQNFASSPVVDEEFVMGDEFLSFQDVGLEFF